MTMTKQDWAIAIIAILSLLSTVTVGGIYLYDYGYQKGSIESADVHALEVNAQAEAIHSLEIEIAEINVTAERYLESVLYHQSQADEHREEIKTITKEMWDEGYSAGYEVASFVNGDSTMVAYTGGWNDGYTEGYEDGTIDGGVYDTYNMGYEAGYDKAIQDLVSNGYTTQLGEYQIIFREISSDFESYYYHSDYINTTEIHMKVGKTYLYNTTFDFTGTMNTIVVIDLYDGSELIGVGGIFGYNITSDISPLVKP